MPTARADDAIELLVVVFPLLALVVLSIIGAINFFVKVVKAGYVLPLQSVITGAYTRTLVRPGLNFSCCEIPLEPQWGTSQQDFISHQKTTSSHHPSYTSYTVNHGVASNASALTGTNNSTGSGTGTGTGSRPIAIPLETQIDVPAFSVPLKGGEGCASIDVSILITIKSPDLVFRNASRNVPHLVVQEAVIVISNTIASGTDSPWASSYADFASRVTSLLTVQVAKYGVDAVIKIQSFDVAPRDSATATAYLLRGTDANALFYGTHPPYLGAMMYHGVTHPPPYGLRSSLVGGTTTTSSSSSGAPTAPVF